MGLELPQLFWLLAMSLLGGVLGWLNRYTDEQKTFNSAVKTVFTALFVGFLGCEIVRHITGNVRLSVILGGAMAYYPEYVLDLLKKLLEKKVDKL